MGAVMNTLRRSGLSLLLVMAIAATAAAQPFDWPPWQPSQQEEPRSAPQGPAPSAERAAPPAEQPPPTEDRNQLLILFLSLLGLGIVLFAAERARAWITTNIPLRRVLGALVFVLRLVGLGLLLAIVLDLVPGGPDWILWVLVVLALVVGWSVRDLFADLVAGGILAAERRVKKGMWVSGDGFQGTVEGRSLRATWLRDGQGHRLTVPNRAMVGAPMVYDAGADAEHEVVVRLEGYDDAGKVRMALTDAILSSPWVLAGATPVVLRDPADPVVWRVRTKLLEPRFSVHFEGELLERVEDLLRHKPVPEERETVPSDAAPEG
jgi:small-conductance mechanosensitive channel